MRSFFSRASFINGVIAGVLIFAVKFILYMTGNWQMRFDQGFTYGSFIILLAAMYLGGRGDRKNQEQYTYWQAMLSCTIAALTALFIAGLADPILYVINPDLVNQTRNIVIQAAAKAMDNAKISDEIKDKAMAEVEKMKPEDIKGVIPFLMNWLGKSIMNGIFGFAVAAFLYRKKAKFDYSEQTLDDTP